MLTLHTGLLRYPRTTSRAQVSVGLLRRILLVGALATVGLLGIGGPASAHDSIVGTTPEDGAQLTVAPTSVSIELSEAPQNIAPRIVVTDENDVTVFDGEPVIDGRTATVELPALQNGTFQVAWRVVSSDGHPIQGAYSFTVNDPAALSPSQLANADPSAQTTTPDGAATDTLSTTPAHASATASDDSSSSTATPWLSGAGIIMLIVIAALALVVLLRRRTTLKDGS
jgi:copper resistance protein C